MLIAIKGLGYKPDQVQAHYITPLVDAGIPRDTIHVYLLQYDDYKKPSASVLSDGVAALQQYIKDNGITDVLVNDSIYLKKLIRKTSLKHLEGTPIQVGDVTYWKGINYSQFLYDDKPKEALQITLNAMISKYNGLVKGEVIHSAKYLTDITTYPEAFNELLQYPKLYPDIEGWGLALNHCGVATIGFAWDKHNGVVFTIDYTKDGEIGEPNIEKRKLLRDFLEAYQGKLIFHNATFDMKHLIFNLFMRSHLDNEGMYQGLHIMDKVLCTANLAYLATNSVAGNKLDLKTLGVEFAGNYAIDAEDITKFPLPKIMEYNLIDCCTTAFVYEKYLPILQARNQVKQYEDMTKQNKLLVSIELHGWALDMQRVLEVRKELKDKTIQSLQYLQSLDSVVKFVQYKQRLEYTKYCDGLKKPTTKTLDDYMAWRPLEFNPNSGQHIVWLLHDYYGLPIIATTHKGNVSVDGDTLKAHLAYVKENNGNAELLEVLQALLEYLKVTKIMDFIKAFMKHSILKEDGNYYLHGSFRAGGTISTRLSSNSPNMQNLVAHGYWGKAIKSCFVQPEGRILLSADFNALT